MLGALVRTAAGTVRKSRESAWVFLFLFSLASHATKWQSITQNLNQECRNSLPFQRRPIGTVLEHGPGLVQHTKHYMAGPDLADKGTSMRILALVAGFALASCGFQQADIDTGTNQNEHELINGMPPGLWQIMADSGLETLALSNATGKRLVFADKLFDGIDDPDLVDEIGDYFVIDARGAAKYAAGHLPGAVNIPYANIPLPENLARLPNDQPILVQCGSGLTAAQSVTVLNMLGYDAYILRFGMIALKESSAVPITSKTDTQTIYGLVGIELVTD